MNAERFRVQARVALVTGGTRGIGAAIAKRLKAQGYKVAGSILSINGGQSCA